jgi:MYXO-CTERM domain-containing protein
MLRRFASTSAALLVAITPRLASAFFPFPGYVQTHLALDYTPPCTICHMTLSGGAPATLVHPFGQAMLNQGALTPSSTEAEVDAALDDLTRTMTDSDCNGIIDTKQLQDGRDPNPPGEYIDGSDKPNPDDEPPGGCADALQPVLYGCGAQLSPAAPSWAGSAALVVALGIALARRRSREVPW